MSTSINIGQVTSSLLLLGLRGLVCLLVPGLNIPLYYLYTFAFGNGHSRIFHVASGCSLPALLDFEEKKVLRMDSCVKAVDPERLPGTSASPDRGEDLEMQFSF